VFSLILAENTRLNEACERGGYNVPEGPELVGSGGSVENPSSSKKTFHRQNGSRCGFPTAATSTRHSPFGFGT
jgi:hypothetical protein